MTALARAATRHGHGMTPSLAAASPTVVPAAPFAVVSTVVHDREWWAEEAVRAGTDRSGVVAAALELLITAGILELSEPESLFPWGATSWRDAAAEYHRDRSGRRAIEIEPKRLERLRPLMAIDAARAESLRMERAARSRSGSRSRACSNCLRLLARFWRGRDTSPGNVINAPAAGAYPIGVAVRGAVTDDATCRVRSSGIPVMAGGA
jgi:hypothetical protein